MMRGFCPREFCPEGAYVLMELCMEGVLSEGVLSKGVLSEGVLSEGVLSGGGFVPPSHQAALNGDSMYVYMNHETEPCMHV